MKPRKTCKAAALAESLESRRLLTSAAAHTVASLTPIAASAVHQSTNVASPKHSTTPPIQQAAVGTFTQLVHSPPGGGIGTMLLLPDGSVMTALGETQFAHLTPDANGSYVNGTWTVLSPPSYSRLYDSTQILPDGRFFIAGGEYGTGTFNGETYNPLTNSWTVLPAPLGTGIKDAESMLLDNGKVLISPVYPDTYGGTLLFDPSTNTFSNAANLAYGYFTDEQSFVKLRDGSVLTTESSTSQRYIPSTNQWIADATIPVNLLPNGEEGPGFLLSDGRAIFFGGLGNSAIYTPSGSTAPGSWVAGPSLPGGATLPDAPGAMLGDGTILLTAVPSSGTGRVFFIYDPTTNAFTSVTGGPQNSPTYTSRMLDLPDGSVLICGDGIWVYNPNDTALAAAVPQISSVTANANGTLTVTGTNLNGISAGAAYGDDAQMATNFPVVRFTSTTTGLVYYGRSSNWTNTDVQTGSTPESVTVTLPLGIPAGTYSLVSTANGVASAATSITLPLVGGDAAPTIATPATAGSSPLSGTSTTLSVTGADDQPTSNLIYTWATTSAPSNKPLPTFSINGTNAAATTNVTFFQSGTYTFNVTITDAGGLSTSSSVTLNVVQKDSAIKITPTLSSPALGGTDQLTAKAVDQFGINMTAQPTSFAWQVLSGPGSVSTSGLFTAPSSGFTSVVQAGDGASTGTATVGVPPAPWATSDIGSPSTAGAAFVVGSTYTVAGAGNDIGGTSDQFRFAYQALSTDGQITARVASITDTDNNAKAGLMIRDSLSANAAMSFVYLTPPALVTDPTSRGWGLQVNNRTTDGGSAGGQYYGGLSGVNVPYWLRLVRKGTTVSAFHSIDGVTWASDGSTTLPLGTTAYFGLAVTSANSGQINTATFDNVSVLPVLDTITGTTAQDTITLSQDPDHIHDDWTLGSTTAQVLINDPAGLTINGNGNSDTINVSYQYGNPLPNTIHLNGTFTINGLTGSMPLAGTNLEIGTSTVYITYTSTDPITAIQSDLASGYNSGAWTGGVIPTVQTISATGYNRDVIAEATAANASAGTSGAFDGNYVWYEQNFTGSGTTGLPASGSTFTSAANPLVKFAMQPYTASNCAFINGGNGSVSLTLGTPAAYGTLSFLAAAANGNANLTATLHFSDASTVAVPITVSDWFGGANAAWTAGGRIIRSTTSTAELDSGNPRLYEYDYTVPLAYQTKQLASVTFAETSGNQVGIFAMSGAPAFLGAITSAAAAANANRTTGIGYADSADGLNTLPANTIELKYTLYGDTGLSGTVSFTDFMRMTQHFNAAGNTSWRQGDFNYDGTINTADFNLLKANYGQTLPAPVPAATTPIAPTPASPIDSTPTPTTGDPVPLPGAGYWRYDWYSRRQFKR